MAWSFNNGIISGDGGYSYDLNKYLQEASTRGGGDTTGGIGALHSFYDNYAVNQGGATNPTNALLGGTQYQSNYNGNPASAAGQALLPQIQSWWQQNYKPPSTTSTNALSPQQSTTSQTAPAPAAPPNPWQTQPKPVNAMTQMKTSGPVTTEVNASTAAPQQTAGNAFQLPAGFNLRTGSTDPTDPTGQNQAVYGTNYFPGGLPGFEGITNAQQFAALTPEQQGSYREALYLWNQRQQGLGPQPGQLPIPALPGDPYGNQEVGPYPGGGWQPPAAPPSTTPPAGGGTTPATTQPYQNPPSGSVGPTPAGPPAFGGGQDTANSGFPFPGAYTAPPFDYNEVEDFTKNPAYQARLKESERALQAQLLNMGRADSTGGINAFATNARRLTGEFEQEAYNRAKGENVLNYDRFLGENMTAYDRALTINKMTYDRAYQENVLSYEREFKENERKYGRDMAENILAYERTWNEDAREYERVRWLVQQGLFGTLTSEG